LFSLYGQKKALSLICVGDIHADGVEQELARLCGAFGAVEEAEPANV
jgi:hypothetical protein